MILQDFCVKSNTARENLSIHDEGILTREDKKVDSIYALWIGIWTSFGQKTAELKLVMQLLLQVPFF